MTREYHVIIFITTITILITIILITTTLVDTNGALAIPILTHWIRVNLCNNLAINTNIIRPDDYTGPDGIHMIVIRSDNYIRHMLSILVYIVAYAFSRHSGPYRLQ